MDEMRKVIDKHFDRIVREKAIFGRKDDLMRYDLIDLFTTLYEDFCDLTFIEDADYDGFAKANIGKAIRGSGWQPEGVYIGCPYSDLEDSEIAELFDEDGDFIDPIDAFVICDVLIGFALLDKLKEWMSEGRPIDTKGYEKYV